MPAPGPPRALPSPWWRRLEGAWAWALLLLALANLLTITPARYHGPQWWRRYLPGRPAGIILHHSASPATAEGERVDAEVIDRWHARRGFLGQAAERAYHIGYHYVILPDGTIQHGRPENMRGAHCRGHNDQLGICLVGNFSSSANPHGAAGPTRPTPAQLDALDHLLKTLIARYGFTPADLHRHRDYAQTACPGDRVPFTAIRNRAFAPADTP